MVNNNYLLKTNEIIANRNKQIGEIEQIYNSQVDSIEKQFQETKAKAYNSLVELLPKLD